MRGTLRKAAHSKLERPHLKKTIQDHLRAPDALDAGPRVLHAVTSRQQLVADGRQRLPLNFLVKQPEAVQENTSHHLEI